MKCPKCNSTMTENSNWEDSYDRLDSNYPSDSLIRIELKRRGIYQYICPTCQHKEY